jgi:hypothetical protein
VRCGCNWTISANKRSPKSSVTEPTDVQLQFTNVPAHDDALMFVLANQQRRHSMLRAVAGRVNESSFACFVELVDDPDFDSKLQHAIDHPNTKDAKHCVRTETMMTCEG